MPYKKREISVKERICQALIRLVSSDAKPYDQITIQEIVDEAGVCRNSFYRNFKSKNDIFTEKFQEVAIESGEIMRQLDGDFYHKIICSFFETARRNKEFLLCFYKADPKTYFDIFTGTILRSNTNGDPDNVPAEKYYRYAARAWLGTGILTEWMKRDCDVPMDEIIEWFEQYSSSLMNQ